jgi:hypothetical protein
VVEFLASETALHKGAIVKNLAAFLALLTVTFFIYKTGRLQSTDSIVHADETSRWTTVEIPLMVIRDDERGIASVQGFWQPTNPIEAKQPISPVAVTIECTRFNKTCGVFQASVSRGVLQAEPFDYYIATWTKDGIAADDFDEGRCGLHHHLSLDFKSNSVAVTDYPKNVTSNNDCQEFQGTSSFTLHGGQVVLNPPAPWDPLPKP